MNRQDWIDAASEDMKQADARGANYEYRTMRYVAAIAKLQMAGMTPDAPASPIHAVMPRQDWEAPMVPRITEASEWLPGDPV